MYNTSVCIDNHHFHEHCTRRMIKINVYNALDEHVE